MENILERLKQYRDELYKIHKSYSELNNMTRMGHPTTKAKIEAYESSIRSLERLFPELIERPVVQKIK